MLIKRHTERLYSDSFAAADDNGTKLQPQFSLTLSLLLKIHFSIWTTTTTI